MRYNPAESRCGDRRRAGEARRFVDLRHVDAGPAPEWHCSIRAVGAGVARGEAGA